MTLGKSLAGQGQGRKGVGVGKDRHVGRLSGLSTGRLHFPGLMIAKSQTRKYDSIGGAARGPSPSKQEVSKPHYTSAEMFLGSRSQHELTHVKPW